MVKLFLMGVMLAVAASPTFAQGNLQRKCLHDAPESAADRARREQAIDYARKVNAAETAQSIGPRLLPPRYRPLDELVNLPAPPAGFAIEFHNDDRGYVLSLKDTRDACRYAVFTDQDKLIYEAVPRTDTGGIVPLGTR